jgi:hypothetical protein
MANGEPLPELMTTQETAALLRMAAQILEGLRMSGKGPPYTKVGPGKASKVLYRREQVMAWLAQFDKH